MRICLLVDSAGVREYFISALEEVEAETDSEVNMVIVNQDSSNPSQTFGNALKDGPMETISYVRRSITNTPSYLRRRKINDIPILSDTARRYVNPISVDGEIGERLPENIIEEIKNKSDIVIRHGFGILQGRILSDPKHGVLSYHHGDIRKYRGVALGFWNFLYNEPTAGITLQRLKPQLDAGEIIAYREINIEDCYTWQEIKAQMFEASIPMLAEGIRNVSGEGTLPDQPESFGELYTKSDVYQPSVLLRYALKNNYGRVKRALSST